MNHAEYIHYLQLATHQLKVCAYTSAKSSLSQCLGIATQRLHQQPLQNSHLEAYCKVVILLAATQLRLHQQAAAVSEFAHAMKILHQLYYAVTEPDCRHLIRRYQAVLVRASQCAHTVYRLKDTGQSLQDTSNEQVPVYH